MTAPSPALSNNSSDTPNISHMRTPPKTLRGLNKPKCIQCGNVARSRCPYQSCKSCCSKAENPCHIHVLKANPTFPEKTPTTSTPPTDQPSTEVSPAASSFRVASLRQLSNHFSQFNNLHTSRSKKPLTRKEAAAINEWRFSKLKEYRERNIEVENEAFDRYMQNVNLLEDVFSVKSILESTTNEAKEDGSLASSPNPASVEDGSENVDAVQKLKLRLNPPRSESIRTRIQQIVDSGLKMLQDCELEDGANDMHNHEELGKRSKKARSDRTSALNDLIDKLNKARNEEDLASCFEMKSQLYDHIQRETKDAEVSHKQTGEQELDYLSQKLFKSVEINQEDLIKIGAYFSSLEKVANL